MKFKKFLIMFNQFRFKRNNFRKIIIYSHTIVKEKNNFINILNEIK